MRPRVGRPGRETDADRRQVWARADLKAKTPAPQSLTAWSQHMTESGKRGRTLAADLIQARRTKPLTWYRFTPGTR